MGPILLVLVVALVVSVWVRATRRNRANWLNRLSLPGRWTSESDGEPVTLELDGRADGGAYVETSGGRSEQGRWRVTGQSLVFTSAVSQSVCELRVFDEGRIGLDGPGRERRIYQRQQSNVVPLRRGQQ